MPIKHFSDLLAAAKEKGPKTIVAVNAQHESVLEALVAGQSQGMSNSILVGNKPKIIELAQQCELDISDMEIIHETDKTLAARQAMILVRDGQAHIAMKGQIDTATFMRAVLDREMGLRSGELLSHVAVFDLEGFDRLIFISDAGINISPTLTQKADIIRNAIYVAHRLGLEKPRVAVLASNEMVNPKIQANIEAAT